MKDNTISIHGGFGEDGGTGATVTPLFQSTAFAYESAEELAKVFEGKAPGFIYSRINNPTNFALESRLTQLEGGVGCIVTSSGMAAITAVAMGLLKSGDEIVASSGIFGGTVSLFKKTLSRFDIKTVLVDGAESEQYKAAISEKTKFVFVETIGNPRMDVPDIGGISEITKAAGIPLVVDSTVTTPALVKPKELGADIVIHSTSKFINGHGTAIGGAIVDAGSFDWAKGPFEDIAKLAKRVGPMAFLVHLRNLIFRDIGCCASPANSLTMLQGLDTLGVRMERHCSNAVKLAEFLEAEKNVGWVNYPSLASSEYHDRVNKQFGGKASAVLTFGAGDKATAFKVINSLKLAKNVANLGDAKTLVIHPASTIFAEYSQQEREAMKVTDDIIRVSVGIEDIDDIIDDFRQAVSQTIK